MDIIEWRTRVSVYLYMCAPEAFIYLFNELSVSIAFMRDLVYIYIWQRSFEYEIPPAKTVFIFLLVSGDDSGADKSVELLDFCVNLECQRIMFKQER